MGRSVGRIGGVLAGVFAVREIARAGAAIVKVGGEYVGSLNKIQALTDSSNRTMARAAVRLEKNSGLYAKMGQTTGDAAFGVVELTKAGLSLDDSLKSVRATMTLAKAGELSVADASTLVANTLNTFSLKAKDASKIANGLANAANISSADVSDLAESFKYVSPIAAKSGVSLDQVNAILAELSNSGVQASQAGTGLRKFLLSLQAPSGAAQKALDGLGVSVYDADGKMRPLPGLIGDLRSSLGKLSQEKQNRALKDVFGLVGVTSAQIILKNGTKGLATYTKGVQKAGAAQKLANAASKGLKGTLNSLKSSAISTAQSLYRQFSPKLNRPLQELAHWVGENKDKWIDAAKAAGDKLVPALKSLADMAATVTGAVKDTVVPLAKGLLPAFEGAVKLGLGVVKIFNDLPGPVKSIGVQAAIAALILPRLTSAVNSATTSFKNGIIYARVLGSEMVTTSTRARLLQGAMVKAGAAAKSAAGIGGMVLLAQGAQHADDKMGLLFNTLGGAATGFALGGPIGALIGGASGGILGLYQASKKARDAADAMKAHYEGLADTLDQVTGATTAATRAFVFDELTRTGAIKSLEQYGISARTTVSAVLGQKAASEQVARAIQAEQAQYRAARDEAAKLQGQYAKVQGTGLPEEKRRNELSRLIDGFEKEAAAHKKVIDDIRGGIGTVKSDTKAVRERSRVAQDYAGKLKAIPKRIRSKIVADGIIPTVKGVAKVAHQYKLLSNKKIKALIEASGADTTVKQVRRVLTGLESVSKAKANLSGFQTSVRVGAHATVSIASTGGHEIGANLKSGVIAGFAGTADALASQAASAVYRAVAAAKAAGKIQSPSRVMRDEVGAMLGKGLVLGFIDSVTKGKDGIKRVLDRLNTLIEKRFSKRFKKDKVAAAHTKALLKSLKDERAALLANGRAQDQNTRRLEKARQKLHSLTQEARQYAKNIKDGIVAYGSVVGLGTTGDSTAVSLPSLLSQLTARAAAALKFRRLIRQLRKDGLNKTSIQQLLDAGVEGGLATAQAIAAGGTAAVNQVNQLTSQIASTGSNLGKAMKKAYFSAGLQAAQGLVDGLKRKQKDLDKIADRLAKSLVAKVKKALGIHSPSRVFRDIGRLTGEGLKIGLNDVHVTRAGSVLAADLQRGFGQPALSAYMSSASSSAAAPVKIELKLTAQQIDQLSRGKAIQADIDAYLSAGGRKRTR